MLLVITGYHALVLLRFAPHHLDAVNDDNETPLMWAVLNDNRNAAKILVRAGADVRTKDKNDRTVFVMARKKEMLEILKQHQQVMQYFNYFKIMRGSFS